MGSPNLFFDLRKNVFFKRDDENIVFEVTSTQIPAMEGVAAEDLFMSKGHIREPHWHPNAGELALVIRGELIFAILDPKTPQLLTYRVRPGQSVFIPQGWWHWITAVSEETHVHVIFNNDQPETVEGSDVLRLTPPGVFALAYSVNAVEIAEVLAPITQTVVIGPVAPPPGPTSTSDLSTADTSTADTSTADMSTGDTSTSDFATSDRSATNTSTSDFPMLDAKPPERSPQRRRRRHTRRGSH